MAGKNPTTLIVNGANWLGAALIHTLIENKGDVIVLDDFNQKNIAFIKRFTGTGKFIFIEKSKIDSIKNDFKHIKYVIHLQNDINTIDDSVSSKRFLAETKFVDQVLTLALEKNSQYVLVSSMHLHKDFILKRTHTRKDNIAYTESDLQDYLERAVLEYHHKSGLNARITRIANIYGPEMDLSKDNVLAQILSDAVTKDYIRIRGDGLEFMYYVYISDAVQGILKALFTHNVAGQIFSISNPEEISVMSIANKILSFQPRARRIEFQRTAENQNPLYEQAYIPDPNLSEIGWKPSISFERGLANLYDFYRKDLILQKGDNVSNQDYLAPPQINFTFDSTINLSDSIYYHDNIPYEPNNDFSRKLNDSQSPIYNINNKEKVQIERKSVSRELEESKFGWFGTIIIWTFIVALIVLVVIPAIRIVLVYNSLNNNLRSLLQNTTNYRIKVSEENYRIGFNESIMTIRWLLPITGNEDEKNNILEGLNGIDRSIVVYKKMQEGNLYQKLKSKDKLSESDYVSVKYILVESTQAQSDLKSFDNVWLPDELRSQIKELNDWLQDNISLASSRVTIQN